MGRKMSESFGKRADDLKRVTPQFVVNLRLYPTAEGGRANPILPGFGCPCSLRKEEPWEGYDGWPLLGDEPLFPGEMRQIGYFFLFPESAEKVRRAGKFYLWELKFIGEAEVLPD